MFCCFNNVWSSRFYRKIINIPIGFDFLNLSFWNCFVSNIDQYFSIYFLLSMIAVPLLLSSFMITELYRTNCVMKNYELRCSWCCCFFRSPVHYETLLAFCYDIISELWNDCQWLYVTWCIGAEYGMRRRLTLWCVLRSLATARETPSPTIYKLDLDNNFLWKWRALYWGMLFLYFIINILHYRVYYLVTLVQSYGIINEFEFRNIFGKLSQNCLNNYSPFFTPCKTYKL